MNETGERTYGEQAHYRILFTRHAERLPSGALSPYGIETAKKKGESFSDAEIVKAYASNEKSKRTVVTGDIISRESGTTQQHEDSEGNIHGKPYATREVPDITYDVFKPDMKHYTKTSARMNDVATVQELDSLSDKDEFRWVKDIDRTPEGKFSVKWEDLSQEQQIQVAPIRARNQKVGFDWLLQHQDAVHRAAFCAAHQLLHRLSVASRHHRFRDSLQKEPEGDVVQNVVTHRFFIESLLLEAGEMKTEDGSVHQIQNIQEFGGWLEPLESIEIDLEDPSDISSELPVIFEHEGRPQQGSVVLNLEKIKALNKEYLDWKAERT